MSYTATAHCYYNSVQGVKPVYRGIVRFYTGTPVVEQFQCDKVHYSKATALKDAQKLITKLKIQHAPFKK